MSEHEAMLAAGWSDGLPLIPPTADRVAAMMAGTAREPTESLGLCPPMYNNCTVGKVATNAVMAGCEPSHLRVVLAAVEAMLDEPFNLHGVHATTMGATPCVIVSGPIRHEAGLDSSHGALGSGDSRRANLCIGRAVKLVLQNVGGAKLGGTESTTIGTPMKLSMCVAEAEELFDDAPGWAPYHVASRGANHGDSMVTVLAVTSGPHQMVDFTTRDAHTLVNLLGAHLAATYACHLPLVNEALLVVSPEHFTTLKRGGVVSKEQLATCLWHCANRAASRHIVRTLFVAKPNLRPWVIVAVGSALGLLAFALSLLADLLSYLLPSIALYVLPLHSFVLAQLLKAPKFTSPTSFHILVAGANAGKFSTTCAGFGVGLPPRPTANLSMACSAKVEEQGGNNNKSYSAKEVKAKIGEISIGPRTNSYGLIDPTGAYPRTALNPSLRLPTLDNATIGLLDISKPGGSTLLDQIERRLLTDYPNLRCMRVSKPTFSRPMPKDFHQSKLQKCTTIIAALAD